jgi:hypothetical protein
MTSTHHRRWLRAVPALIALALAALSVAAATNSADASHRGSERLVVRGDARIGEGPCANGVCELPLIGGKFRGTPVGAGDYTGTLKLNLAAGFPNGEGGGCAPIEGTIVLGAGTPNRLVLALSGDSCQDGAGALDAASFTQLAQFRVKYGTGTYAHARGSGILTSSEDAADRDRMTLVGRISR